MNTYPPDGLTRFAEEVLEAIGMRSANAAIVADSLVYADLRGVGTHGVARLASYIARVEHGVMQADPEMPVLRESVGSALLDAANGFGQVAGVTAMRLAIAKSASTGIAAVSVANSNHFGVAGYFSELATLSHRIGIVLTNASPAMAPYNAALPILGTNPISIGIPAASRAPVILDMSSSLVARGKIRRAHLEGKDTIPDGWAVDSQGAPTTDPAAALSGMLAPMGGPKGAGLSLAIDLLSGVLSGTTLTGDVTNITNTDRPSKTGHLFIALDPEAFTGTDAFEGRVDQVIERVKALPSVDGGEILLPGELERKKASAAEVTGLHLPQDVVAELKVLADRYDLEVPVAG